MPRAQTNPMPDDSRSRFTPRQGQYLAFIHAYTLVIGRPPAEADMQRFFRVSGPAVHQMIIGLEKAHLISREPGTPRSIRLLVERSALPELQSGHEQPVTSSVQGY
jgi:SOS-response transcriptional repressor LexA